MTKQILKYKLKTHTSVFEMPAGARVLSVTVCNGGAGAFLWVLADTSRPLTTRTFDICGEGLPVRDGENIYVGTFTLLEGALVFHIFEK